MALPSGTKLGPYEIQSPLGAGGMGEVYRARDTRLNRIVAIKILPAHLSNDPEFKQRLDREARTVSSLNHSHICQLFDVGQQEGTDYLVMEFLDGETLADRLRRGAMPFPEVLKIGMEMAEALNIAHHVGIVHRDLKPGNIMLTKAGAKLMDFGLAKPVFGGTTGSASAPLLSAARTVSGPSPMSPLTTAGSIVGTIQYMSPEQIEGKEADPRADIFALGAVLYEMATGTRPFQGKSQISVASAILEKDPEPVRTRKPLLPESFDYLVASCMTKEREDRLQSAQDVRIQLKGIANAAQIASPPGPQTSKSWKTLALLGTSLLMLLAAGTLFLFARRSSAPALSVRAYIPPPPGTAFRPSGFDSGPVAVSPDGKTLAFTAIDDKGNTKLWIRALDASQATMLPGTDDAAEPFWSPDNKYLAFIADGKLKKINVSGGEPQPITDVAYCCGDWGDDDTILFEKANVGVVSRVAASGGEVSTVTKITSDEYAHFAPAFLPDGKHFLYTAYRQGRSALVKVGQLGKPDDPGILVAEAASMPRYSFGWLLFVRSGKIMAQRFDPSSFKLSGDPQTLGEASHYSISRDGVLAYHESSSQSELKVFDRGGNAVSTPGPTAAYYAPRFSPDGKSIAVTIRDPKTTNRDIWIFPTMNGQPVRATFGPDDYASIWSPDGKSIVYGVHESNYFSIRRRSLNGSSPEETIYKNDAILFGLPIDWSPDGKYLSLDLMAKDAGVYENWILPMDGSGKAFRPASTAAITAAAYEGRFSLDGQKLAYFSYESGRPEVYVVPFLSQGAKYQATTTGGWLPRFAGVNDFYFLTMANRLIAGRVVTQPNFHLEDVRPLFQLDLPNTASINMDVSRDGQRFVVLNTDRTKNTSITLLTNWPAALNH